MGGETLVYSLKIPKFWQQYTIRRKL